jgi:hypothetical protein
VFASEASNLVAGDTNSLPDIFLRDRDPDEDGIFDEAGAASTTRVNLGPGGVEGNGASERAVISQDGRFIFFASTATNFTPPAPVPGSHVFRVDRTTGTILRVASAILPTMQPAVSRDGDIVAYAASGPVPGGYIIRETTTGRTIVVPAPYVLPPNPGGVPQRFLVYGPPSISADGRTIAYLSAVLTSSGPPLEDYQAWTYDWVTGVTTLLSSDDPRAVSLSASGDMAVFRFPDRVVRRVLASGAELPPLAAPMGAPSFPATVSPSGRYALTENGRLNDFDLGLSTPLAFAPGIVTFTLFAPGAGAFSVDDRWLAVYSGTSTLVGGDTNGVHDVFVIDLPDRLDADDDTMHDGWEARFGVTDPGADTDADGVTNALEEDAGTHPNGQLRRFLAEGATGSFFRTYIALANPSPTLDATAVVTFDRGDGTRVRRPIAVPAGRSMVLDAGSVTGLAATDVSTTVESDRFLGVERSMTWGTTAVYGSHAETSAAAPGQTWFLAEGSTVLGMDLFYLLQNPQPTTTHATVRFLLPSGAVVTRTYDLAPSSRTTIYVNQVAGLEETDVSADISADAPVVVERSQYRSTPGQAFTLGHDSMGVQAASTSWFFAEGATGTFFDLFLLIANPGNADATVQALYSRADGVTVARSYTVRAHSRFSIFVDAIPGLEQTALAATFTSNVPIVAERAMYWPGGYFDYYEGHSSAGSTTTALDWVVAGAEQGGADAAHSFILIANTENRVGAATVTLLPDATSTEPLPPGSVVLSLPPNSRTTVPVSTTGTYGARVTSTGATPVQIVVESAVYRSAGGVTWSAGSNSVATPVP